MPVSFNQSPIDMLDPVDWADFFQAIASTSHNSTSWSATNSATGETWQFTGVGFGNYQNHIPFTGTITGITYRLNGVTQFTATGASVDVLTFLTSGLNGDWVTAVAGLYNGADTIVGTSGADRLYGFASNDTLSGGDGMDYLDGGAGDDVLDGGNGDDTFSNTSAPSAGIDSYNGGAGVDYITFIRSDSTALTFDFAAMSTDAGQTLADGTLIRNMEGFYIGGGTGDDTLVLTGFVDGGSSFDGGGGADRVLANLSAWTTDVVLVAPGQFLVSSFLGVNLSSVERFEVTTGSGADSLSGGVGGDVFDAGSNADSVSAKAATTSSMVVTGTTFFPAASVTRRSRTPATILFTAAPEATLSEAATARTNSTAMTATIRSMARCSMSSMAAPVQTGCILMHRAQLAP